jgi:hypothetical protein
LIQDRKAICLLVQREKSSYFRDGKAICLIWNLSHLLRVSAKERKERVFYPLKEKAVSSEWETQFVSSATQPAASPYTLKAVEGSISGRSAYP